MIAWFVAYFSPYAPGCAQLSIEDPRRKLTRGNVPAPRMMHELLGRLGCTPDEIALRPIASGDVAVMLNRPGAPRVPLAFIVEPGEADCRAALSALANAGAQPSELL